MGIFDRLFKKKKVPPPEPRVPRKPRKPTVTKEQGGDEDTRPIKLPDQIKVTPISLDDEPSQRVEPKRASPVIHRAPELDVGMQDDEIEDAIDSSFDELFGDGELDEEDEGAAEKYALSEEELKRDREETRDLFGQIAVNYIRPVKQFMFELSRGSASADWIPVCLPAIDSMLTSLKTMNLGEEEEVLQIFRTYLEELLNRDIRVIEGEYQKVAMELYGHLTEILPQTFTLGDEGVAREGIIIFSLLKQIPDVGKVTLDKLFAAGLSSLDMLFMATPRDLSRTTGIPSRLSEKICEKIQEYKEEYVDRPVDRNQESIVEMLERLVEELEQYHNLYEELISSGWNDPDFNKKKKEYRKERQETSLKINVLLAELGEVEMVEQLERLPFDRRIETLMEYLTSAHQGGT